MIAAATLLPIAPLLLLPFIIVFFIAIFPPWLVTVALLGAMRWLAQRVAPESALARGLERALQWVVSFGGLIKRNPNPDRQ
jgi:uncharacterized SAM-binding protein YcdF (DUF218 family)